MTRIVSGVIMATGLLALLLIGNSAHFFIFTEFVALICLIEMYAMFKAGGEPCFMFAGTASGLMLLVLLYTGVNTQMAPVLGIILIIVFTGAMFSKSADIVRSASNTIFVIVFVAAPLACLALLRAQPQGQAYVIMMIGANAFGDTFAYYTGRAVGKTKLAPSISPGKTVEGFLGGLVGAFAGALAIKFLFFPSVEILAAIGAGVIAGLIGPLGDLAESAVKRKMGVKDSGSLIPGHGGVLDRVDSLLFTSTAFYLFISVIH